MVSDQDDGMKRYSWIFIVVSLIVMMLAASCTSKPVINSFVAEPASITEGGVSTLSWDISGVKWIVIDKGIGTVLVLSTVEVHPYKTTTYTVTATNAAGSATKSVTVTVTDPTRRRDPSLPTGMGAFSGKVLWGDKPLANSEVVADTHSPIAVSPIISGQASPPKPTKTASTETDKEGNYRLIVEPDTYYYIGCSMPGSDYISYVYRTLTFESEPMEMGPPGQEVESGEVLTVNLQAIDWSIELISPGNTYSESVRSVSTITQNPPTLTWKEYGWAKYGEVGYYKVELSIDEDGYNTIVEDKTRSISYTIPNALKAGKYSWQVKAYTNTNRPIAAYMDTLYFRVP